MIYGDVMQIKITKTAFKDMKKLDFQTRDRILRGINKLPIGDVKRLQGYDGYYRLRIGDFRIIYYLGDEEITISAVLPRGDVYKHI